MRIVYMGTPDFAVPGFRTLAAGPHRIVGAVTQPDRPSGRGRKMTMPPLKREASAAGVPLLQPESLTDPAFLDGLRSWNADCFAVVAFRILPVEVFGMPPLGTVNLHASLLPKFRGAAPVQWALMRGETETGVTTFFIRRDVDTGDCILQERTAISPAETAGELLDRLSVVGAACLARTMDLIAAGQAPRRAQQGTATSAPKIKPEHCAIDWRRPAAVIVNQIRGLSPKPGAVTSWNGRRLKCFSAGVDPLPAGAAPGTVTAADRGGLVVAAGGGCVRLLSIQPECRDAMPADAFVRGYGIQPGALLEPPTPS